MRFRRVLLFILALVIPASGLSLLQKPATTVAGDAVAQLQKKVDSGTVKLEFDATWGYLKSVLKNLDIPASSQALVFAKSSFQLHLIAPDRPRALYFNDDVYVGWARGGEDIEFAAVDPQKGPMFYMLSQTRNSKPKFKRETENCTVCHDFFRSNVPLPRLLMLSVLPDPEGYSIGAAALVTNDPSPMRERWGGFYVTGTHGSQRHLGNLVSNLPASTKIDVKAYAARADLSQGANVTDLSDRFETKGYLTPHSDIVGLMVLGHQTHVHNMIVLAAAKAGTTPAASAAEPLVRSMLFVDAVPLTDTVKGTSEFAAQFASRGPRDSKGRSLRDLDLNTRLLRYPLSYLIYSDAFNELPGEIKTQVYRRLNEVLTGEDKTADFAHLTEVDRKAIMEILRETKPETAITGPGR